MEKAMSKHFSSEVFQWQLSHCDFGLDQDPSERQFRYHGHSFGRQLSVTDHLDLLDLCIPKKILFHVATRTGFMEITSSVRKYWQKKGVLMTTRYIF